MSPVSPEEQYWRWVLLSAPLAGRVPSRAEYCARTGAAPWVLDRSMKGPR